MSDDSKKKFLKQLLEASEAVLQKDHPNPNRVGCPGPAILEQLAHPSDERSVGETDVIRHVAECYPCFRELREMRSGRTASN